MVSLYTIQYVCMYVCGSHMMSMYSTGELTFGVVIGGERCKLLYPGVDMYVHRLQQ